MITKAALLYNDKPSTFEIVKQLNNLYNFVKVEEAEAIIVVGGDGQLLHSLHHYMHLNIPFYGINSGSVGFLMNQFNPEFLKDQNLIKNINKTTKTTLSPLEMKAETADGEQISAVAINEVSIFRQTNQSAKFQILINNIVRIPEVIADGALVATPAGSSAYNLSAGGLIVPLEANILSLTAICPFRPRRWHGALLPYDTKVQFSILEYNNRPVNAVADFHEYRSIKSVTITSSKQHSITLLFDQNHNLEDRIVKEQFAYDF